jgi:hypothetical protein
MLLDRKGEPFAGLTLAIEDWPDFLRSAEAEIARACADAPDNTTLDRGQVAERLVEGKSFDLALNLHKDLASLTDNLQEMRVRAWSAMIKTRLRDPQDLGALDPNNNADVGRAATHLELMLETEVEKAVGEHMHRVGDRLAEYREALDGLRKGLL